MISFSLLSTVLIIIAVMALLSGAVGYGVLAERKLCAYMQDRVGPNRVGPWGLLQPLADGIKFFFKEDVIPLHVDKVFYLAAPCIAVGTALMAFSVVPFGPTHSPPKPVPIVVESGQTEVQAVQAARLQYESQVHEYQEQRSYVIAPAVDIGILLSFAIGSLAVYGIILGGWSANSKYSLLGSLRSSAQIISYEIPLGMSILGVVLFVGSLNLERIIGWQADHGWFILYQPLAFLLFMLAVFAECNRLPFDLPEAEQELVGGYHTEYSSMKFLLFMFAEYTHMITTCFLMTVVFFGGWHFPGLDHIDGLLGIVVKFGVVAVKVGFFVLLYMLIRWTIPRFRFDQLMSLAWQVLIPLAILNLLSVMIVREYDISKWVLPVVSIGLFFGAAIMGARDKAGEQQVPAKA